MRWCRMIEHGLLKRDWPWVRAGIERICARQRCEFVPEDIYCLIKNGKASLYVNNTRDSFTVAQRTTDGRTGEEGVRLVVTVCDSPADDLLPEFEKIAKDAGCTFMEMDSQRKGFARTGWEVDRIVYRRRLGDG